MREKDFNKLLRSTETLNSLSVFFEQHNSSDLRWLKNSFSVAETVTKQLSIPFDWIHSSQSGRKSRDATWLQPDFLQRDSKKVLFLISCCQETVSSSVCFLTVHSNHKGKGLTFQDNFLNTSEASFIQNIEAIWGTLISEEQQDSASKTSESFACWVWNCFCLSWSTWKGCQAFALLQKKKVYRTESLIWEFGDLEILELAQMTYWSFSSLHCIVRLLKKFRFDHILNAFGLSSQDLQVPKGMKPLSNSQSIISRMKGLYIVCSIDEDKNRTSSQIPNDSPHRGQLLRIGWVLIVLVNWRCKWINRIHLDYGPVQFFKLIFCHQ